VNSESPNRESSSPGSPLLFLVTGVFFLSGSAGLVYQVLWMRSLGLFFGSDMYGVSIILSTFMGGLALGSWLGGLLAERTPRPLLWYGMAELGIGCIALPFAAILAALDPMLRSSYTASPQVYEAVRVLLASGTLLIPTTLMGATLPLIMKHFVRSRSVLGEMGAYFYAVNTLGALIGTLAAGFVLLPRLGMARTTWCAASINLAIGGLFLVLGSRSPIPAAASGESSGALDPIPGMEASARLRIARIALIAFGLSGFCSFALEVVWTRILLISFSATVYSFAATLSCFLFGIFLGTRMISRIVDEHPSPIALFAKLELGVAASLGALGLLLHAVPGIFGRLLTAVATMLPGAQEHALVIATLLASFPLLVVPATLLGATFPVALRIYTTNVARVGSRTGNLYASNTLGAVLGSLAGGLLLLPNLGAMASLALVTILFLCIGTGLALTRDSSGERVLPPSRLGVTALATLACVAIAVMIPYRVTLNFNQKILDDAELLYHADGVQNTIDVVRSPSGATSLIIGGNVEADNGYRQRRHFVLKGHLPLLFQEEPRSVLVVGLGMGITLQATANHPGLERIEVVELSPDILAAQAYLGEVNGRVVENPLVTVRIGDGRLFMKMTQDHFDMVTADPIHPKISRVAYLYTKEYYESIRERLNEGGTVCQWMPIYQISPLRLRSAVKSFVEVFPHATLWYVEGHLLFVAKLDSPMIDYELLVRKFQDPTVRADLASIDIHSPEELLSHLMMGPEQIRAYIGDPGKVPTNTDDYPYLEYFVPGDLFHSSLDNVRELSQHLANPSDIVRNMPPDASAKLAALSEERKRSILVRREGSAVH